jgi:hypothetical protein
MTFERRIGREMGITVEHLRSPPAQGAWPTFAKNHILRCDTGRSALQLALRDWRRARSSQAVAWVPSYACPSIGAAVAAAGFAARLYADRPGLSSWPTAPTPADADIVVVIHYFGVINRAACAWLESRPHREWGLIEDCVQAPYTAGAGVRGDYAIASLRKWWPAPDGALVCSRNAMAAATLAPPDEHYISQRLSARLLNGSHECDAMYLKWVEESEQLLAGAEPRQVSWISSSLLASVDPKGAAVVRRDNWSLLREGLQGQACIRPVFDSLALGEVPLGFPVLVSEGVRDRLRTFLKDRQVFCPVHWKLTGSAFPADRAMSDRILTIPLDQRYDSADMQLVLTHIREFLAAAS